MEDKVLRELPPLLDSDFMYVADRRKKEFTYPIHKHEVFELNYVENGEGVLRIVGDSAETIGNRELVLITSPDLEHVWEQDKCKSEDIREITVQFFFDFNSSYSLFNRTPLLPIKRMFEKARKGVAFTPEAIDKVYPLLDSLSSTKDKFYSVINFLTLLYELSLADGTRELASSSFAKVDVDSESRRILKVKDYISKHYTEEIRLADLADLVGMSTTSFSRFFKLRSGKTLSDYVVEMRLGVASRQLVDTTNSVSEICYDCGFNTLSNFNRLFRKYKGCSPTEFREKYFKTKIIV
ncbi:AraC family transcriptional regulator [uncultured Prevotella sp.]|uniref:AraC family transcriptional regulator n=1 Tax=uncultured Prevotella sp. TaxID=159272 RepID=UPI0027E2E3EC|nr:AraC family transcriptional regulator [uncultured Prevotella sp.]